MVLSVDISAASWETRNDTDSFVERVSCTGSFDTALRVGHHHQRSQGKDFRRQDGAAKIYGRLAPLQRAERQQFFQPRDRVLNLEDYQRSLDNLVSEGAFNPETKWPWIKQDADARWAQVKLQATTDQANCALLGSLPFLQKKLDEMQQQASAPQGAAGK
jgi:hypothetical protein